MEIIFSFFLLSYIVLIIACFVGWSKLDAPISSQPVTSLPNVSVVIAMRNETANLPNLVQSLLAQDYPKEKFEVIVVDDSSQDHSVQLLQSLTTASPVRFKIVTLSDMKDFQGSFKKRALTAGINEAVFPVIVTTDADCTFNSNWLHTMMDFMQHRQASFISGPVSLISNQGAGQALRDQEFAALIGIGASFLTWGYPNMCNGANLAFTVAAFQAVNGYQGYEQVVSGDDEFLLYKISQKFPRSVYFIKNSNALVQTLAPQSWKDFLNQRRRWSGKWKFHRSPITKGLALFIFTFHGLWLLVALLALTGNYSWPLYGVQLSVKIIAEFLLIYAVLKFQGKKLKLLWFFLGQVLYSCYTVFFGIFANIGRYNWKDRRFK